MPNAASGRQEGGSRSTVRSIAVTTKSMIHSVIASGSQISRPVMKYFFSIGGRPAGDDGPWRGLRTLRPQLRAWSISPGRQKKCRRG